MIKALASLCVAIALALDTMSYWKQVAKILRTKKSGQVSSSAYLYKIAKTFFSIAGLVVYSNYVGVTMEVFMAGVYIVSLIVIAKYKPKGWSLWK